MQEIYDALVSLGAKLNPPATAAQITRVSSRYNLQIPPDVRALYEKANGSFGKFGFCWKFWEIDADELTLGTYLRHSNQFIVKPGDRSIDPNKYARIFDCLIDAPIYAYCADEHSPYFGEVIGGHTIDGVFRAFQSAKSITAFLHMLITCKCDDAILMSD